MACSRNRTLIGDENETRQTRSRGPRPVGYGFRAARTPEAHEGRSEKAVRDADQTQS